MISVYKWQKIKAWSVQGKGIKEIAKELKMSKNTVRKYLRSHVPPNFHPRKYHRLLNEYRTLIDSFLEKHFIGTRIFIELKKCGYSGSLSTVHRYLATLQKEKKRKERITTRVETLPGKQMQYDWTEWMLPVKDTSLKIYLHQVMCSYSRKKYYTFSTNITAITCLRALYHGFFFFQGIPEEVVVDNGKQMITTHGKDGVIRFTDDFLFFCGSFGIEPYACFPNRPQTKGKVERAFSPIKNHLLQGLSVQTLSELEPLLEEFTESENRRLHSVLKETPNERFEREKTTLRPLPEVEETRLFPRVVRKVSFDGYLSYRGKDYPVPMASCGEQVFVDDRFGRLIAVYNQKGEEIGTYELRCKDSPNRPIHPEHDARNLRYQTKREMVRSRMLRAFFDTFAEAGDHFLEGLRQKVGANLTWHCREILNLTSIYEIDVIKNALFLCTKIHAFHKNYVLGLIAKESQKTVILPGKSPFSIFTSPVDIHRDLREYSEVVSHE